MAEIRVIPAVAVHEVALGGAVSGVAPDGVDSVETFFRGRYRKWIGCTVAGLFKIPADYVCGWSLRRVLWNLPGSGGITVNLIDDNGFVYPVNTSVAASGSWVPPDDEMLVPPGWAVQVVSPNPLGALGRLVVYLGDGWGQTIFDGPSILGNEQYPPPKM